MSDIDDDLALHLSAEEREALAIVDGKDDTATTEETAPEKATEVEDVVDGGAVVATTDDTNDTEDAQTKPEAVERQPFVPQFTSTPVADLAAKLAALDEQFEIGEITQAEYLNQRDALRDAHLKAEVKAELSAEIAAQAWVESCERFLVEHAEYAGRARYAALNEMVKAVAVDPEYAGRSHSAILERAHALVIEELGAATAKGGDKQAPPASPVAPAAKADPAKPAVPTLALVPNADIDQPQASEFAALDALDGPAYEKAIAAMSPAQHRRYLGAA